MICWKIIIRNFLSKTILVKKIQYYPTKEQAEKAIQMCLQNARSFLDDADMYISKNRRDHLAIPIEFAMEEIGKAKIIYDKLLKDNSKILLSDKDGIYSHETKMKKTVSLIELDFDDEIGEAMAENLLLFGDSFGFEPFFNQSTISNKIKKETELKNTGNQSHKIRLTSSFVDFDPATNEPKIEKPSVDLTKLMKILF